MRTEDLWKRAKRGKEYGQPTAIQNDNQRKRELGITRAKRDVREIKLNKAAKCENACVDLQWKREATALSWLYICIKGEKNH